MLLTWTPLIGQFIHLVGRGDGESLFQQATSNNKLTLFHKYHLQPN